MMKYHPIIVYILAAFTTLITLPVAHATDAIQLGERSYHILVPDNWDGTSPLPTMLYFHGWGRQGLVPINHKHVGGATRKHGVLLIAPNGLGKSWDFWRPGSRDTVFAKQVLADAAKRYPIDTSKILASGYSWGASMAWRFACEAGTQISTLLSISGTLYDQTEECATGPVEIRHVHGLKDTVMDYPYGPNQDESGPVHLWTRTNNCNHEALITTEWETSQKFKRMNWQECETGKSVTLDIHKGGHWIAKGWLNQQLKELMTKPNASE